MSIKRKIAVIGVISLALGCLVSVGIKVKASDDNTQVVSENQKEIEEKIVEISKQVYLDLINGNAKNVYDRFDEISKENISLEAIEGISKCFNGYTFIDWFTTKSNYIESEKFYRVVVVGEFEEDYIQIVCNINLDKELVAICEIMTYENMDKNVKPIENDIFKEQVVKIGKYELTGILTLPKNKENVPVVVIESGSGPTSANGKSYCLNPYQDIAYGLAKYGIATLRYNDRYYERPEVGSNSDTIYDEYIDDASAAIKLLGSLDGIDKNNIFVLGHSQGGSVIPTIAKLNSNVKGIISLAGTPRSIIYGVCEQFSVMESLNVTSEEEKNQIKDKYDKILEECLNISENSEEKVFNIVSKTYLKSINDLNIEDTVRELQIPMLILQGDKDVNVTIEKDYTVWQRLLENRENAHFKIYEGLSHNFTKSFGFSFGQGHVKDMYVENHVEDEVIKDIADFVKMYK